MPIRALEAGFFSSLFADQALADSSSNTVTPPQAGDNSQNINLLQANVSSLSVIQDKTSKDSSKTTDTSGADNSTGDQNAVSDNALVPATGPLGVSDGKDVPDPSVDQTSVYVVRKGDSISQIATMFGVSVNTILWANDMKKGDKLTEGDVLFILPVSGLEHTVTKGQTIQGIAKLYKVDVNDIVQANDITLDTQLAVGDTLIIPNAEKSCRVFYRSCARIQT